MNTLYILQGVPGCGKSHFIRTNGLEEKTLSMDELRIKYFKPVVKDGKIVINNDNNTFVFNKFKSLILDRVEKGADVYLDATHIGKGVFRLYKQIKEDYPKYKLYIIRFNISLQTALMRNEKREELRFVPEDIIKNMHKRLGRMQTPHYIDGVIKPHDFTTKMKRG